MKIYIAGPYSAPTPEGLLAHVQKAMAIGGQLILPDQLPQQLPFDLQVVCPSCGKSWHASTKNQAELDTEQEAK